MVRPRAWLAEGLVVELDLAVDRAGAAAKDESGEAEQTTTGCQQQRVETEIRLRRGFTPPVPLLVGCCCK